MNASPVGPPEWGFDPETPSTEDDISILSPEVEQKRRTRSVIAITLLGTLLVGIVGAMSLLGGNGGSTLELNSEETAAPLPETGSEPPSPDSASEADEVVSEPASPDDDLSVPLPRTEPRTESEDTTAETTGTTVTGSSTSSTSSTSTETTSVTTSAPVIAVPETVPVTSTVANPPPNGVTQVAYADGAAMMIFEEPDQRVGWALPNPTQFGGPRVVAVLGTSPDQLWHKVSVPVQPNGSVGWVKADSVRIEEHNYHARITLSSRRVQVWDGDTVVTDTGAVIGKSSTPTPLGTFFVRDIIPQSYTGGAYGPWILALSGFSEVMDSFGGGLPAIAVHGTNRPDLVGSAASNGCIRIPNEIVTQLAGQLPLGTQVEILA